MKTIYTGIEQVYARYPDFMVNFLLFLAEMDTVSRAIFLFGLCGVILFGSLFLHHIYMYRDTFFSGGG